MELVVSEPRRRKKKHEAADLPRVRLTTIDLQWMHVLREGWASPLRGFMRESEFLQTLHFNSIRLDDGSVVNMSVPIFLAINDQQKSLIGESKRVALVDSDDNPIAILSEDTFIWGEDMDEWAPIHMVYGLEPAIATWEVRLGAAATTFLHKLQKGIPPWVPLKGREPKTHKQLQNEAIQSKKSDVAVIEANYGVWPGLRTSTHAQFLWASGSELTTVLEADHMPNREELAKVIPELT